MKITLSTSSRIAGRLFAVVAFLVAQDALSADSPAPEPFTVQRGYLSANVQQLVNGWHWHLNWDSGEDRIIDYPFEIGNASLEDGLNNLLVVYSGAFVADVYTDNQVVHIINPSPLVEVELPAAGQAVLAMPVFYMSSLDEATVRREFLEGLGYETYLEESRQDGELWHRVSVRYRSESELPGIREELEILGYEVSTGKSPD